MGTWSFYYPDTGHFAGIVFEGDADLLTSNTPNGCAAIDGRFDHLSQTIDLATGGVVDWQPPSPAADAMRTWSWASDTKRWVATPTLAAVAANVRADRDARLAACDWVALRAADTGEPVSDGWRAYRAALRDLPARPGFPLEVDWPAAPTYPGAAQVPPDRQS